MKRFMCALLLAFMVSCPSFAVVLEQMQTSTIPEKIGSGTPLWVTFSGSSVIASNTYDQAVQTDQNLGYLTVATPTLTITSSTPTNIGAYLPAGTKGFVMHVFNGALLVGNSTNLSSGSFFIGYRVASDSDYIHRSIVGTPHIYGLGLSSTVTVTLQAWGK